MPGTQYGTHERLVLLLCVENVVVALPILNCTCLSFINPLLKVGWPRLDAHLGGWGFAVGLALAGHPRSTC